MKILVMGSGGVGGFVGGRLVKAGCDVTFVARGAHYEAMRERGLVIENRQQGDIRLSEVEVTQNPETLDPVDLVLIAVKLWDTEAAVHAVRASVGPETMVLSLQNGVVTDDILRREFGESSVIGGMCYVATHIARPGVIRQTGTMQRVVVGEYDGQRTPRVQKLLEALQRAGLQAEIAPDIKRALWEKFTFLVGLSGATATMRQPIGPIRTNPQTRAFLLDVMQETVHVGRALEVELPEDYAQDRLRFADTVPPDMTSSMHHDLEKGKPLEVEWLSGGVVKLGTANGVPTPVNRAVWDILALHAGGRSA